MLRTYHFPGNIRELEGMIFDAVSRHTSGVLSMSSFREKISPHHAAPEKNVHTPETEPPLINFADRLPTLDEAEQILIAEAMQRANGNQTIAASLLGLSRRALNNRLRRAKGE